MPSINSRRYWDFKASVDRLHDFDLEPDNALREAPNYCLGALKELRITFAKAA